MNTPDPNLRWFYPTPGRLLVILLAVEGALLLSERFQWFAFNEKKGWTVLIAVAAVGVFLLLMLLWFISSLIFRWHFQFSIRSLLVLTISVAIPFSWLAVEIKWAREQKELVEAITKDGGGGGVKYDDEFDKPAYPQVLGWMREQLGDDFFRNVAVLCLGDTQITDGGLELLNGLTQLHDLDLSQTKITDAGLKHLKGMKQLRLLGLAKTQITDAGLEYLKGLKQLEFLDVQFTKITDVGLEHLKRLDQLQLLDLKQTQITDTGLEHLRGLKKLEYFDLSDTKLTDVGLEHLKGMKQLQRLSLADTQITDGGLELLNGLTQLQYLNLSQTKTTDAGVKKLQKALPALQQIRH
ncbi:MAG: hypothetical protein IT426_08370 [Pirellulales bacterium]|nr:hypothetical protein [Pirellulales bacterium]